MANPSKKKGTGGETELLRKVNEAWRKVFGRDLLRRNPPSTITDLGPVNPGLTKHRKIGVLATRPDKGRWLITLDLNDFLDVFCNAGYDPWLEVEVKRYKRFSLHSTFEQKFKVEK